MIYAKNKKAFYDYEFSESFEAGIILKGNEVKSIRDGRINLKGSWVSIENNEVILKNCYISKYESSVSFETYDELRNRKLLLHKKEINKIINIVNKTGYTLIITEIYQRKGKTIKAKLMIGKGKKDYDKRRILKNKQIKMDLDRNG